MRIFSADGVLIFSFILQYYLFLSYFVQKSGKAAFNLVLKLNMLGQFLSSKDVAL